MDIVDHKFRSGMAIFRANGFSAASHADVHLLRILPCLHSHYRKVLFQVNGGRHLDTRRAVLAQLEVFFGNGD